MIQIVGVDHWLQEWELWTRREYVLGEPSAEEIEYRRVSKSKFYDLLESMIKRQTFSLVAEECREGQDTIPRRLSSENGLRYIEIDMNRVQREGAGITREYENDEDSKARGYELREKWMVAQAVGALGPDQNGLVICGRLHINGLGKLFGELGFDLSTLDISNEPWARNPIMKSMNEGFD